MDIIEKIGDTITEKGKVAADKAKELAAIANLKSQISTCEEVRHDFSHHPISDVFRFHCNKRHIVLVQSA